MYTVFNPYTRTSTYTHGIVGVSYSGSGEFFKIIVPSTSRESL